MASVMLDSSKIWRKLSSVKALTSMSALQKLDRATMTSAIDGQDGGDHAVADDRADGELRRPGVGSEGLAAVGDEAGLVAEQHLLGEDHDHPERQQRRADRGRGGVVDRRLRGEEVHLRRQHPDPGVATEQQGTGELAEPEEQGDAAAVDERRTQQGEDDPEEHAEAAGAADLRRLQHLRADVGEPRADEEVDEGRQAEPGEDDDPRQRVDVDRALLEVVPPRQVAQQGVEVARPGREEERPADDRGDGGHDDRQDGQDPQHLHPRRQP